MEPITSFSDDYRFLSNFWYVDVKFDNIVYPTVEHAYQAAKSDDKNIRRSFVDYETPGKAKRAGSELVLRHNWKEVRESVMFYLLRQKFEVPYLREKLMATKGRELIEGNVWNDTFWGQCPVGVGENKLGKILMGIRDNPFTF